MAESETAGDSLAARTVAFAQAQFGEAIIEVAEYRGETTIVVAPDRIQDVCRALRDAPELRYDFLADLTAVDWEERVPRFDVVYHLLSIQTRAVIRLKARVGDEGEEHPHIGSVTAIWPTANWYEREVWDLMGIVFDEHPDLRRIQMPDDWTSHPLRKDYPLTGITLPDPHWGGQVPYGQPLAPGIGQQTLRTPGGAPNDLQVNETQRQATEGEPSKEE